MDEIRDYLRGYKKASFAKQDTGRQEEELSKRRELFYQPLVSSESLSYGIALTKVKATCSSVRRLAVNT